MQPAAVVSAYIEKAKVANATTNAYLTFANEYVENNLASLQSKDLRGAPIAVKDNILTA
ncbi:hypothetical protein KA478_03265 [Patescibacteria group bacterium]|nr:hypothetical protein [Patescibacteria group bacterium]